MAVRLQPLWLQIDILVELLVRFFNTKNSDSQKNVTVFIQFQI